MTEGDIVKAIRTHLVREGYHTINMMSVNPSGTPDMLAIKDGKYTFFEVKTESGRLSPIQIAMHKKLINKGCYVYTVRSVADVKEALNNETIHTSRIAISNP